MPAARTTCRGPAHAALTISLVVTAALCALGAGAAAAIPRTGASGPDG